MFDYEFVRIKVNHPIFGSESQPEEDYHAIIRDYAQRGWRLVQVFAPSTFGEGRSAYFELIFERERQET